MTYLRAKQVRPTQNSVQIAILISNLPRLTANIPPRHIYGYFRVIRVGADNSRYDDIFTCETSAPYPELCPDCDFDVKLTPSERK